MVGPFKATCAEGWVKMFWAGGRRAGPQSALTVNQEKDIGHQLLWEGDSSAYVAVTTGWRMAPLAVGGRGR